MSRNEDYNWLDDPFDEKKAQRELEQTHMSGKSKAFIGIGCLAIVVIIIAMAVLGISALASLSL